MTAPVHARRYRSDYSAVTRRKTATLKGALHKCAVASLICARVVQQVRTTKNEAYFLVRIRYCTACAHDRCTLCTREYSRLSLFLTKNKQFNR